MYICGTKMIVESKGDNGMKLNYLDVISKVKKQPLLITENGKEIVEGYMDLWMIDENMNLQKGLICNSNYDYKSYSKIYKYFSCKEAAENYIIENKPCLSLKDIKDCYNYAPKGSPLYDDLILNLEEKVRKNV